MIKSFVIALVLVGLTACNRSGQSSSTQNQPPAGASDAAISTVAANADPASGNLAPVADTAMDQTADNASQVAQNYAPDSGAQDSGYASYDVPADAQDSSQDAIEAADAPPPLPDYSQPECPGDDYLWNPGYWDYASAGYYWVPGAWVVAPWVNALWTPPYWEYRRGRYFRHAGYWGPHIGFYGGINYGFGYTGRGYFGAYWNHGVLDYNRSVTNVKSEVIHNIYSYPVPVNNNRVSYNGGRGGVVARPTVQEMAVVHDPRTAAVPAQIQHTREASTNRAQFASGGRAPLAALVDAHPLATGYRAPASAPPPAAIRAAARPPAPAPLRTMPNEPLRPLPVQGTQGRTEPEQRQPATMPRTMPEVRMTPEPVQRPAPEVRGAPQPAQRPAPEVRSAPQPAQRPAPEVRSAPQPAQRPAPEVRPAEQRPAQRPAPEVRSAPQPTQRPAPEVRPAEQRPAQRPAPESRSAEQPAQRQEARPEPRPEPAARPAPEVRAPEPPRPAPEARPAPPPSRPAPQQRPDEKKG